MNREPQFRSIPSKLFTLVDKSLTPLTYFSKKLKNSQQFIKIAKYYATESMLFYNHKTNSYDEELTPEFGTETLESHYNFLIDSKHTDDQLGAHKLF